MNVYQADLHIHTCLSPCGSLEMSPATIVQTALRQGLNAIAITDHNTTLQCNEIKELGAEYGLVVFYGVEVTTREEAHCVAFFETETARSQFQLYLEQHLPRIPNNPDKFGDQVWVNRNNEILGEVPYLLISAITQYTEQVAEQVHLLGGLFVAAHIERPSYSLISQLGFINDSLPLNAIEYTHAGRFNALKLKQKYLTRYTAYTASDAHCPEQIGACSCSLHLESLTFQELKLAMSKQDGRYID